MVPNSCLLAVWPRVAPELERALAYSDGENSIEDVLDRLMDARMQLWVARSGIDQLGFGVTEIDSYGQFTVCRIVLLVGEDFDLWVGVITGLERWALEQGCTALEWWGRPGFEKPMRQYGYTKRYVVMRKRLQDEPDTRNLH